MTQPRLAGGEIQYDQVAAARPELRAVLGMMSKRNCAALGHDLPAKERCAKRAGRGRHHGGPKRRLALRREVENDAGAIGNCEPWQEPPVGQFLRGPFADARGGPKLRAPPMAPVRALPAGRGSGHGIEPAPGRARFSALCFAATASKPQRA